MRITIRVLLFIALTGTAVPGLSQIIDAGICDRDLHFPITSQTCFLRSTSPITIDSVLRSKDTFTKADNQPVLEFKYDPYYYWLRIIVQNRQPEARRLMLLMAPFGLYEGGLYQKKAGQWQKVAHTGLKYRFEDRTYQFTHHVFPFDAAAGSIDTLYLSIDASNAYKYFGFALLNPRELKMFENKIYFVFGIIVGLLILFFVLNISLFFSLKEKLHLWYALYIFLLFLVVMKNDLLDQQFLWLDSELAFRLTPYMTIGALAIAVLMHVAQRFLKPVLSHNKRLYRFSTILKMNVVISAAVHAVIFYIGTNYRIETAVFNWARISTLLAICFIIIDCIYCIYKGQKSAWFILTGSFIFMFGSVQRLFYPSTLSFLFPPTTFHLGIITETFIITVALIYRFWSEREKQRERETQIQVQTLHDISEEIHDNVGQTLALANLHLRTINLKDEAAAASKLEDATKLISKTIIDLRGLSRVMKNDPEHSGKMADKIKELFHEIEKTGAFKVELNMDGEIPDMENTKQAIVIRILQEITQNIIKHARATVVNASIIFTTTQIILKIRDNGIGFDMSSTYPDSNGLKNITNRCLLLNATCFIDTGIGKGTEIAISIPIG
ncbi:7TM diverse intracellular signaling domain-containing protein [Niastella sp. OAS944]|uniref:sensor histidine kinase n=1 Tax=Niastella sp. OAS944 TaxID=2664089 RepID=UPI003478F995|nr:signal transduction histidine kinase [Chitinophagaceae bacterium OAS944]